MAINFNQLRIFYHAAKNLSFTKAAEELFITQPAVTNQMRAFEKHYGFKLFQQIRRKLFLTPEGEILFKYAQVILEYEKDVEHVIEEMQDMKQGILRLGAAKTYSKYFLPYMISLYKKNYAAINIRLHDGSSEDMVKLLLEFTIDLAIIAKVEDHPEIKFIPFSREELVPIVSPKHRLAGKTIGLSELAKEPLIMKEIGSGTRRLVNETFKANGMTPDVLLETSNADMIKQLVFRGEGYAFLSSAAVIDSIHRKELGRVYLHEGKIKLDVYIAHVLDYYLTFASQAFLNQLLDLITEDENLSAIDDLKQKLKPDA